MTRTEMFMGLDLGVIKNIPKKELKVERLSKIAGNDVTIVLQAVPAKKISVLRNQCTNADGVDTFAFQQKVVLNGIADPDFKSASLREKYGVNSGDELIGIIFNPSEIDAISAQIIDLSGYGAKNVVTEVKN